VTTISQVNTLAGSITDCYEVEYAAANVSTEYWLCPDIGFVFVDHRLWGYTETWRLMDFRKD
jgi:hypothetical protein